MSRTKVALISCNLGGYEPPCEWPEQQVPSSVELSVHRFTDREFPPRRLSMTPRLQARLVKCFGWQLVPGMDRYIWMDAALAPRDRHAAASLLELAQGEMTVFLHPDRHSIREECEYHKECIANMGDGGYQQERYASELHDEQMAVIEADREYRDDRLFVNTCFLYRNTAAVRAMMKEWWHHITRYHVNDQLSFPYVIAKSGITVDVIQNWPGGVPGNGIAQMELVRVRGMAMEAEVTRDAASGQPMEVNFPVPLAAVRGETVDIRMSQLCFGPHIKRVRPPSG